MTVSEKVLATTTSGEDINSRPFDLWKGEQREDTGLIQRIVCIVNKQSPKINQQSL